MRFISKKWITKYQLLPMQTVFLIYRDFQRIFKQTDLMNLHVNGQKQISENIKIRLII